MLLPLTYNDTVDVCGELGKKFDNDQQVSNF